MSRLHTLRTALARWIEPPGPARDREYVPLREALATGATIDPDEDRWQRLTASPRDIPEITQTRMQDLAVGLWRTNMLARQIVEIPINFLLARGVRVRVQDPDAQRWVDAWWSDPITDVAMRLPEWMRGLRLYGEQVWPVYVDPHSGHVRTGYLDPGRIETVIEDPDNASCPVGIVTRRGKRGEQRRYRVIYLGPETLFAPGARRIRETLTDGDCWYWRANVIGGAVRGTSDMLAAIDWLDAYEQFLYGEIDRADFLRAFVWDVSLAGATETEVQARARQIRAPGPGGVRVHNDSETWRAVGPDLKSYEGAAAARMYRNHILSGVGSIPEHWSGGGGDVNRATAAEMGEPATKAIAMQQQYWSRVLARCATYAIWRRLDPAGLSPPGPADDVEPDLEPTVDWPEMVERDVTRHSSALQQTTAAVAVAVDRGLLTEETALALVVSVAERLGVEIDPPEELAKAQAEAAGRAEADVMPPAPAGDGEGDEGDGDGKGAA